MTGARYRHLGGALVTDHGGISLAVARDLAVFYARESQVHVERGAARAAHECAARAQCLIEAIAAASLWRRAAGWSDPDMADQRVMSGR